MNTQQPISPEFFAEMQGKALEAFSVLADMNHRVLQGLVGLSASTAKEGLRTYAELQTATVEAARTSQSTVGPEAIDALRQNPFAWYQRSLLTLVEGTQKAFHLVEANSQVVTRTAERVQASAEQTGQEIQETLMTSVNRLKEIYARA
ncbi:MAG TPA: hypothetical protein VHO73_06540 [Methylomirabilota bacterium]|jgi:hypothetical protein|nr:hypothetical protein [Methylomirabilota bacterium]